MAIRNDTFANAQTVLAWDTILFDKFARFREVIRRGGAQHSDEALRRHRPARGARAVDLGVGFGDTTFEIARCVGPEGGVLGIDASPRFVEAARREATERCFDGVRFEVGDVQSIGFERRFEFAFSRFGTMFFSSPGAALANVRRALVDGGRLCMIVWRRREDNAFVHLAERVVGEVISPSSASDELTCGPGPFSMASADVTSDVLHAAGFRDIAFERHDAPMWIGADLDEAVAFAMALGPAGEALRLAGAQIRDRHLPTVVEKLREMFEPFAREDGVSLPSSTWFVTART